MEKLLIRIMEKCSEYTRLGKVANYIPALAIANPDEFGICVFTGDGNEYCVGDSEKRFTMQSVAKPAILMQALIDSGAEAVRGLVGIEATGKPFDAFNYSDQALNSENINPMINTGAIALGTLIKGLNYTEKFSRVLDLVRAMTDNPLLDIDMDVYHSEKETGNKNRALAYMLKAYGMIHDDVEEVLDCYFKACSISVTAKDLAHMGYKLANKGFDRHRDKQVFKTEDARYVNATLMTCGMYDGSGEFALNVGFPAKSGVGGGIMGVVPGKMGIGIYSPALDQKGNSVAGIKALEMLSKELDLSIF